MALITCHRAMGEHKIIAGYLTSDAQGKISMKRKN